jgi:hypothetical protein
MGHLSMSHLSMSHLSTGHLVERRETSRTNGWRPRRHHDPRSNPPDRRLSLRAIRLITRSRCGSDAQAMVAG